MMIATRPPSSASRRVAGSFRDPSGYVFQRGTGVYRAIDGDCHHVLDRLSTTGTLGRLMTERRIVPTWFVEDPDLRAELASENPGYCQFLGHRPVEPITYPCEWTVSMLADAAIHTLRLQLCLLEADCSLKDASAYNVQFVAGRPTFIDLASIERPRRKDLWHALGQFHRMFTFPLLLCRHRAWDLRSYFLAAPGGRSPEEVARAGGRLGRWRPSWLLDVTLPCLFGRWASRRGNLDSLPSQAPSQQDPRAQQWNLRRLRSKLRRLADGYRPRGVWATYSADCHYDQAAEEAKKAMVREFLTAGRPDRVVDLGSNSGDYSYLAAECGARVVAVDGDHDALDLLYRRLRREPAAVSPMVVDVTSPTPGLGFRNAEHLGFFDRVRGDCVLALALVHHLIVQGNLSPAAVRDLLFDLTEQDVVVEFVPPSDPMFRRLLMGRTERFGDLRLAAFRRVFEERFSVLREADIPQSRRTLLFLRKRM